MIAGASTPNATVLIFDFLAALIWLMLLFCAVAKIAISQSVDADCGCIALRFPTGKASIFHFILLRLVAAVAQLQIQCKIL